MLRSRKVTTFIKTTFKATFHSYRNFTKNVAVS